MIGQSQQGPIIMSKLITTSIGALPDCDVFPIELWEQRPIYVGVPSLIEPVRKGSDDCRVYYLDAQFRKVSSRPEPVFRGTPRVEWSDIEPIESRHLWTPLVDTVRDDLCSLLKATAEAAHRSYADRKHQSGGGHQTASPKSDKSSHYWSQRKKRVRREVKSDELHLFHACQILAAARLYHFWHLAWAADINLPRRASGALQVKLEVHDPAATRQLRALLSAATTGTAERLEVRWRQMTPATLAILQRALDLHQAKAARTSYFASIAGGRIVSSTIPSRQYLQLVLPVAVRFASTCHGARLDREEALLGTCRRAFLAVTQGGDDLMTVGRLDVPNGPGADFIQAVEDILKIHFMSEDSRHMIRRLREISQRREYPD
jgi:hypothetical protein